MDYNVYGEVHDIYDPQFSSDDDTGDITDANDMSIFIGKQQWL